MTQSELIEMAKEAGYSPYQFTELSTLEAFANLVAAKEREACAQIADEWSVGYPHPSTIIAADIRARGGQA